MKPQTQFTSQLGNFRATVIPENIIGCEGVFHLYNLNTNLCVGKIYGDEGKFIPTSTTDSISWQQLKEIAQLVKDMEEKLIDV